MTDAYPELDALARSFGQGPPGAALAIIHRGLAITVGLDVSSGTIVGVTIHAACGPLPPIALTIEGDFERRGKKLAISREVQTGDAELDARVYIDSDEADAVVLGVLDPVVRGHLLALFAHVDSVTLSNEGLLFRATRERGRLLYDPTRFSKLLPLIVGVAGALVQSANALRVPTPGETGPGHRPRAPWSRGARHAYFGSLLVVFLAAVIAWAGASSVWAPLASTSLVATGLGVSLVLWALTLAPLHLVVSGRSSSFSTFVGNAIVLAAVLLPVGVALVLALNALADASPPITRQARVTKVEDQTHDDDSTSTHVEGTALWRARGETLSGDVPEHPPELQVGAILEVTTHAGALGWEWIADVRFVIE